MTQTKHGVAHPSFPVLSCLVLSLYSRERYDHSSSHSANTTQYSRNTLPFCVASGFSASSFGLGFGLGLEPALIAIGRPILAIYYAVNPPCSVFVLLMLDREYDMITHSFMLNRLKLSGEVGDRDMSETISEQVGVDNCLLCYH